MLDFIVILVEKVKCTTVNMLSVTERLNCFYIQFDVFSIYYDVQIFVQNLTLLSIKSTAVGIEFNLPDSVLFSFVEHIMSSSSRSPGLTTAHNS